MLIRSPCLENKPNCSTALAGRKLSFKPIWRASLSALYICCQFFSYQAPLDTLRYQLLSGSLSVVSSPGWTRPVPSAFAHRTSASAPLVAPAELPQIVLLGGWRGQDWMQKPRCNLPPINLLPEQLLIHLRMLLVFLAARAHSSVCKDFLHPRTLSVLFIANYGYFCNSLKHTFLWLYF